MAFRLSLAHLTLVDAPPPVLVQAAALAGFRNVGMRLLPARAGEARWPMHPGSAMLRETLACMRGLGVAVHDVEIVRLNPSLRVEALAPALDVAAELGAQWLMVNVDDDETDRAARQLAAVAHAAHARGLRTGVEFMAYTALPSLDRACDLVRRAAHPAAHVVIDSLHLFRSGGTPADVAVRSEVVGAFAQVNDAWSPREVPLSLAEEGRSHRLLPGEGNLTLAALARVLSPDAVLAVESPCALRRDTLSPEARSALAMQAFQRWAAAHDLALHPETVA